MPNTNFQTIHQMGQAINKVVRQATGRDAVQNVDMDYVTVAQKSRLVPGDSYTGNPLTFTAPKKGNLVDILLGMMPQQNLHGYDYPWPGGTTKNKMVNAIPKTETINGITFSLDAVGVFTITGTATAYASCEFPIGYAYTLPSNDPAPFLCMNNNQANPSVQFVFLDNAQSVDSWTVSPVNRVQSYISMQGRSCTGYRINVPAGLTLNTTIAPVIQIPGEDDTLFIPYSNVCPITGQDAVTVTANGTDYTTDLPQTVYGGTLNMATGELQVSWKLFTVGSVSWSRASGRFYTTVEELVDGVSRKIPLKSSVFQVVDDGRPFADVPDYGVYATSGSGNRRIYVNCSATAITAEFVQMFADAQIAYPLNEAITLTVPKQMIDTLAGDNTISTDADSMEVTVYYYEDV